MCMLNNLGRGGQKLLFQKFSEYFVLIQVFDAFWIVTFYSCLECSVVFGLVKVSNDSRIDCLFVF